MTKYCSNCGRELPDEAIYCPDCGKKFVPRTKADFPENNDVDSSDYEFNGPFGPSSKKFEGPFGPHSNRGSYDSNTSSTDDSKSFGNDSNGSSKSSTTVSNNNSTNQSPTDFISNLGFSKICIILFAILLVLSLIGNFMHDNSGSDDVSTSLFSNDDYKFNTPDVEGKGSIENNEPYKMSIE